MERGFGRVINTTSGIKNEPAVYFFVRNIDFDMLASRGRICVNIFVHFLKITSGFLK